MHFVWVIVNAYELVKDCIVVVRRLVSLRQLRKNHSLNMRIKVKVDVIELGNSVANCFAVDS